MLRNGLVPNMSSQMFLITYVPDQILDKIVCQNDNSWLKSVIWFGPKISDISGKILNQFPGAGSVRLELLPVAASDFGLWLSAWPLEKKTV